MFTVTLTVNTTATDSHEESITLAAPRAFAAGQLAWDKIATRPGVWMAKVVTVEPA